MSDPNQYPTNSRERTTDLAETRARFQRAWDRESRIPGGVDETSIPVPLWLLADLFAAYDNAPTPSIDR